MAAKKKPQPRAVRGDIDAFIQESISGKSSMTPEALADLIYFAEQAEEGRVVSAQGILKWLEQRHSIKMSRTKLYNEFQKAGLTPWFGK